MVGRSKVWRLSHFADSERLEVQCNICPTKIKFVGNTTNIARHLELKHPVEFAALSSSDSAILQANYQASRLEEENRRRDHENNAIRRILQRHNHELKILKEKQYTKGHSRANRRNFDFIDQDQDTKTNKFSCSSEHMNQNSSQWAWHSPTDEGEDRKLDMASLVCGNMTENSMGDHPGTSNDDHPMPLSPEQYLTEEIEGPPSQTVSAPRPESYKLRHNNHLSLVLESLADDESFMDVTLTAQGKAIKAHKSVLSAVSSYFKSVLKSNPCQHPIIIMPRDIRFEELNNIISYVYKGEMTVAAEDLPSLLKTAEILQVTGLTPSDSSAMGNTSNNILEQIGGVKGSKTANPTTNHTARSVQSPNFAKALNKKAQKFHSTPAGRETLQNVSSYSNDSADKIDPADFLDADMAYVKEEVVSDDERMTETATDAATDMDSTPQSVQNQADNSNTSQKSCPLSKKRKISVETSSPHVDPGETENNPDLLSDPAVAIQTALFVCPYCFESHRPTEALQAHLSLKHPSKPSFLCKCGKVNIKQTLYEKHMKTCDHS